MNDRVREFVRELASCRFPDVFNPYRDVCGHHDRPDAAAIRRRNLREVLERTLAVGTDCVWVGRDLGYRGGRRTGLALTDDVHLELVRTIVGARRVAKATSTDSMAERTAKEIWKILVQLPQPPFLWNVFPFHPHMPNTPLSNRRHNVVEGRLAEDVLSTLLKWIAPAQVVALGLDAYKALTRLGYNVVPIRHPSYGGQAAFLAGVRRLYQLQ
jgi:hypothetical protein